MRTQLDDTLNGIITLAAANNDENTIALVHRAQHMFRHLPAYLDADATRVTSPLLDGTEVPLASATPLMTDSGAVVHRHRHGPHKWTRETSFEDYERNGGKSNAEVEGEQNPNTNDRGNQTRISGDQPRDDEWHPQTRVA